MALPPQRLASLVKSVAVALACGLMVYLLSPPLYWRLARGAASSGLRHGCSECLCNCLAESESMLLPDFTSLDGGICTLRRASVGFTILQTKHNLHDANFRLKDSFGSRILFCFLYSRLYCNAYHKCITFCMTARWAWLSPASTRCRSPISTRPVCSRVRWFSKGGFFNVGCFEKSIVIQNHLTMQYFFFLADCSASHV